MIALIHFHYEDYSLKATARCKRSWKSEDGLTGSRTFLSRLICCSTFPYKVWEECRYQSCLQGGLLSCMCVCVGAGCYWVNFCWVCAAGLSESLTHFSKIQLVVCYRCCVLIGWATTGLLTQSPNNNNLFCGHIIDLILVTLGNK